MALAPGTRLGPYEISSRIGAGGMGEVYRATDTNLARRVAIKVLPEAVASDAERLARFDREAKTLAALNHPNIAAIYGLERSEAAKAIVMELVEGPTLADRIAQGPIPVDEALPMAKQIAEALEAAHEQGIIHRDLKPANVKVRPDSTVKVLDFGLAKAMQPPGAESPDLSQSPIITTPAMTQAGVVLGTAAYMSPEQARGQVADKRSDVWAFGCVLFEMLTGQRAFAGDGMTDTIAAVLRADPDWAALPPRLPTSIRTLLRRCLEKDPRRRLRDIGDGRLELDEAPTSSSNLKAATAHAGLHWREAIAWGLALVSLLGTLALWSFRPDRASVVPLIYRTSLLPPPGMSFSPQDFAISPDGRRMAFVSIAPDGANRLWVRAFDGRGAQLLNDTGGASYPFWAPDNRRVGFFAAGQLRTVDTSTGVTQTLGEAPAGRGGTWSGEGMIVFAPNAAGPLLSVSERGGRPQPVTRVDPQTGKAHRWPWMLPDQRHFLFFEEWGVASDSRPTGIYAGSLAGDETTLISADVSGSIAFADGHLLYVQDASLMAQPFDAARLRLAGPAVSILDQEVGTDYAFGHGSFSVSSNGVVLFQSLTDAVKELIWHAADGRPLSRIPISTARSVNISPTGRSLAYSSDDAGGRRYLRTWDLQRGISTRLTDRGREDWPIWSNDGNTLAYFAQEGGETFTLNEIPAGGTGTTRELLRGARMTPTDYSPDGRSLVFMTFEGGLPAVAIYDTLERRSTIWARGAEGQYSPDGKWIAWVILGDVFVQAVSRRGSRVHLSSSGGGQPRWSGDGRRLFYLAPDRKMMEVSIEVRNGELLAGAPRPLFQTHVVTPWFGFFQYDVTHDASRFLVNSLKPEAPLTLVTGWPALLRR